MKTSFNEVYGRIMGEGRIDELSETIQPDVAKKAVDIPDGDYDAVRSGYVIEIPERKMRIDAKMGVRGMNIPTHIRVHDGIVDIVHPYDAGSFYRLRDRVAIGMNEGAADRPRTDAEILRFGIETELDAVNLYDQLAAQTGDEDIRKVMLSVSMEEKVHVEEFRKLLSKIDPESVEAEKKGSAEVEDLVSAGGE